MRVGKFLRLAVETDLSYVDLGMDLNELRMLAETLNRTISSALPHRPIAIGALNPEIVANLRHSIWSEIGVLGGFRLSRACWPTR